MGRAVYSALDEGEISATIEIKITYLRPASATDLVCHTQVLKRGRRIVMLESEVFAHEKCIAKASGSFAVFQPSA